MAAGLSISERFICFRQSNRFAPSLYKGDHKNKAVRITRARAARACPASRRFAFSTYHAVFNLGVIFGMPFSAAAKASRFHSSNNSAVAAAIFGVDQEGYRC